MVATEDGTASLGGCRRPLRGRSVRHSAGFGEVGKQIEWEKQKFRVSSALEESSFEISRWWLEIRVKERLAELTLGGKLGAS